MCGDLLLSYNSKIKYWLGIDGLLTPIGVGLCLYGIHDDLYKPPTINHCTKNGMCYHKSISSTTYQKGGEIKALRGTSD